MVQFGVVGLVVVVLDAPVGDDDVVDMRAAVGVPLLHEGAAASGRYERRYDASGVR